METISKQTYRRFLLGVQGLYPGRRYENVTGVETALRQIEALQLDPLTMVARSQDIAMYGRVINYKPEMLYQMAYEKRQAFDYGNWLAMYPMREFPYWRLPMKNFQARGMRYESFKHPPKDLINFILKALEENGPMGNRDFEGTAFKEWSYRGRKDTAVGLYYLWLTGEVMISHRKGFDRFYDLRERVVPKKYDYVASVKESETHFAIKQINMVNMMKEKRFHYVWKYSIERPSATVKEAGQKLNELLDDKTVSRFQIEGSKDVWLTLSENIKHFADLEAGRIPKSWKALDTTTDEEVTLLAPLEMVSARGRAKHVFDFEYVWEVYKPEHQRKWGYYVLPILYKDDLVARLDPKFDRTTNTLHILGFWLEDDTQVDSKFADALAKGLTRFAKMIDAKKIDLSGIKVAKLRSHLKSKIKL
ncbi:MAG: YcaQ family DNA glycosylase [Anaerolineales bacterium]|nr:YcaQ family DNA glycosylase [Anaerolineales bacterium]